MSELKDFQSKRYTLVVATTGKTFKGLSLADLREKTGRVEEDLVAFLKVNTPFSLYLGIYQIKEERVSVVSTRRK